MTSHADQQTGYWPTLDGYAAHLDRGPCGHILCAHATTCLQQDPEGAS